MCVGIIIICEDLILIFLFLEMVVFKFLFNKFFFNLFVFFNVFVVKIILYLLYFSWFNFFISKFIFLLNVGIFLFLKFIIDFIEKLFIDFGNNEFNIIDLFFIKYFKFV